ncbi:hypothetical protein LZG00_16875 [Rhodobacteraceae bacterium LMO-12]|nr:hypothetical protein [Rhodobacteraceae bacterium LMO-JJ12]
MFNSWIIDPDPIISLDIVEILQQQFAHLIPKVFNSSREALDCGDTLPALAIVRARREDTSLCCLLDRLNSAQTPLILLEPATPLLAGTYIQSVPLPFTSDHIITALISLYDATQMPILQPTLR